MRPFSLSPSEWLAVNGLAVYRATRLAGHDVIFDRPRNWLKHRSIRWWDFVTCPWCFGMWAAGAAVVLTATVPNVWVYPATVGALSAAAGWLSER